MGVSLLVNFPLGTHDIEITGSSGTPGFNFEKRMFYASVMFNPIPFSTSCLSPLPSTVQNVDADVTWTIKYMDSGNNTHTTTKHTVNRVHVTLGSPIGNSTSYRLEQLCNWANGKSTSHTVADAIGPHCVSEEYFGKRSITFPSDDDDNYVYVWAVPELKGDCISEAAFMFMSLCVLGSSNPGTLYLIQPCHTDWSHLRVEYPYYSPEYIDVGAYTYPLKYVVSNEGGTEFTPEDYEGVLYVDGLDTDEVTTIHKYWMGGTGAYETTAAKVLRTVARPNTSISAGHQLWWNYNENQGIPRWLTITNQPTDNWGSHINMEFLPESTDPTF